MSAADESKIVVQKMNVMRRNDAQQRTKACLIK